MTKKRRELVILLATIAAILAFFSSLLYIGYLGTQLPDEYTHNNLAFVGMKEMEDTPDSEYVIYLFRDSSGDQHHLFGDPEMAHYLTIETNYRVTYTMNNQEFPKNYRMQDILPVDAIEEE